MEPINLRCTFEERTSRKDESKKYKAIFIKLDDKYEKMVLVSYPEEILILNQSEKTEQTVKPLDFLN